MEFLPVAAPDVGHFHAPNHSILPITQNFHKLFSTDILIVPALSQRLALGKLDNFTLALCMLTNGIIAIAM
jgi:hypothetical protein